MSCNNWERGSFKLPAAEWVKFRNRIINEWNERQAERYETAVREVKMLRRDLQGTRGKRRREIMNEVLNDMYHRDDGDLSLQVRRNMVDGTLPKKKNFPPSKKTSKEKPIFLEDNDLNITINNEKRTLEWDVPEGNRNVESAERTFLAKLVLRSLKAVTWTRGSGGYCVGNDEINRENAEDGGGANYTTFGYGPIYDQQRQGKLW